MSKKKKCTRPNYRPEWRIPTAREFTLQGMGGGGSGIAAGAALGYATADAKATREVFKAIAGQEFTVTVGRAHDDLEDFAKEAAIVAIIESLRPDLEAIVDFVTARMCVAKIIVSVVPHLKIPNGNVERMKLRHRVTELVMPYVPDYWKYDFLQHLKVELRRSGLRGPR